MTCKDCLHCEPCFAYGNVLNPIHGGAICDSFVERNNLAEVVRCKDCKHWTKGYGGFCRKTGLDCYGNSPFGENGYCSRGERKDEK